MTRHHQSDYNEETTARCERVLITLLGDLGPWRERIYLAGGLAPRYLVGELPASAPAHVGTSDVDLVIGLALGDENPTTYRTLQSNLKKSGFKQSSPSFRWTREVDDVVVKVEFLCETDRVAHGAIFRPTGESVGSNLGAFNVRGAQLSVHDYVERDLAGERLDDGGLSRVTLRIAGLLPYIVMKINAFQDRHENKDAYDLIFTLLHFAEGPDDAGRAVRASPVFATPEAQEALALLSERFETIDHDGPIAYANFLAEDAEQEAVLRREARAVVLAFIHASREDSSA